MNPQKGKAIFKELFERHSSATIREGSVIVEQVINPLALAGTPALSMVEDLLQKSNLPQDGMENEVLDQIGERLMVSRVRGGRSVATIRLVLSDPALVTVRKGALCSTPDKVAFRIRRDYTFSPSAFSPTTRWSRTVYLSPEIEVEAEKEGAASVVGAETISIPGFIVPGLIGIFNSQPSSSVESSETNAQYFERLRTAISTRSLDTAIGQRFLLPGRFGAEVSRMVLAESGSDLIARDKVYVRRVIATDALDVDVTLVRSGGQTTQLELDINGNTATHTISTAYRISTLAQNGEVTRSVTFGASNTTGVLTELRSIPFGSYALVFVRANQSLPQGIVDAFEKDFSVVGIFQREENLIKDYLFFAQKGHAGFTPRELFSNPASGDDNFSFATIIIDQTQEQGLPTITFQGKTRGVFSPNPHRLYRRTPLSQLQVPDAFGEEILQEEYNALIRQDFRYVRTGTSLLFEDGFERLDIDNEPILLSTSLGGGWSCGNTGERKRNRDAAAGVYLHEGKLVFGPTRLDLSSLGDLSGEVVSSVDFEQELVPIGDRIRMTNLVRMLQREGLPMIFIHRVLREFRTSRPAVTVVNSSGATSPVVQHHITDANGFQVTGSFWTSDDEATPAAITIARNRPGETEKFRWYEGFGVTFSTSTDRDGLQNLFITDNASSDRQMTVVGDELVNGKLVQNVLAQGYAEILPLTEYNFELIFGSPSPGEREMIALKVRIWPKGSARPSTPTLEYGAYTPINRRDELLVHQGENITHTDPQFVVSTHVGIGVSSTNGRHVWVFDDFKIENVDRIFAQKMMEIDVRERSGTALVKVVARGRGFDHETSTERFGHSLYVFSPSTNAWVLLDRMDYQGFHFHTASGQFEISDHAEGGKVYLLVTANYPHEGPYATPVESQLDVDYVTGSDYNRIERIGGKADLFFVQTFEDNRPSQLRSAVITGTTEVNYVSAETLGGPVEEIVSVEIDGSGIELEENDYRIFFEDGALRGSAREKLLLALDGAVVGLPIKITARVHTQVLPIDAYINDTDFRKVDSDLLIRHKQSVFVDFEAKVLGSWTGSHTVALGKWIAETDSDISLSTLVERMLLLGAQEVILTEPDAPQLVARRFDDNGNMHSEQALQGSTPDAGRLQRSQAEHFVPGQIVISVA
jgi:hypothetical protein